MHRMDSETFSGQAIKREVLPQCLIVMVVFHKYVRSISMSNQPPIEVPQGAIRLNTDSQKLEFFAQDGGMR